MTFQKRPTNRLQYYFTEANQRIRMKMDTDAQLGDGGEAVVVECNSKIADGMVAKIYHKSYLEKIGISGQQRLQEKLEYIIAETKSGRLQVDGVCLPCHLLFWHDAAGCRHLAGFLMPRADGQPLHRNLMNPQWLRRNNWDRRDVVDFILAMLHRFEELHHNNIIMGDVNRRNLLYQGNRNTKRCLMIDADSYQYHSIGPDGKERYYYCPGGVTDYLHPDLLDTNGPEARLRPDITTTVRSLEHECYSVAVVAFELLMSGQTSPFDYCDPSYRISFWEPAPRYERRFVYPQFSGDVSHIPKTGPWQYVWFHLPDDLRQAFHSTFTDLQPPAIEEWVELFGHYSEGLKQNRYPRDILPNEQCYHTMSAIGILPQRELLPGTTDDLLQPQITSEGQGLVIAEVGSIWVSPLVALPKSLADVTSANFLDCFGSSSSLQPMTLADHLTPQGELPMEVVESEIADRIGWLKENGIDDCILAAEKRMGLSWPYGEHSPKLYIYGTSFLRNLSNREAVIKHLREITGLPVGVISQQQEAMAVMTGAMRSLQLSEDPLVAAELTATQLSLAYRLADGTVGSTLVGLGTDTSRDLLLHRAGLTSPLRQALTTVDGYVSRQLEEFFNSHLTWVTQCKGKWQLCMASGSFSSRKLKLLGNSLKLWAAGKDTLHGTVVNITQIDQAINAETDSLTQNRRNVAILQEHLTKWPDDLKTPVREQLERRNTLYICREMMRLLGTTSLVISQARCKHGLYAMLYNRPCI